MTAADALIVSRQNTPNIKRDVETDAGHTSMNLFLAI
jgi:hypothetical protein